MTDNYELWAELRAAYDDAGVEEHVIPTPEQVHSVLTAVSKPAALHLITTMLNDAGAAARCFIGNHDRLGELHNRFYVTGETLAAVFDVHQQTVQRWFRREGLPGRKIGKHWTTTKTAFDAWLAGQPPPAETDDLLRSAPPPPLETK